MSVDSQDPEQGVMVFRDASGRAVPPARVFGKGFVYVGNVPVGETVVDPSGKLVEVIAQYEGSTSVRRPVPTQEFETWEGEKVSIQNKKEIISIAKSSPVRRVE